MGGEDSVERMVIHFADKIKRKHLKDLSTNKRELSQPRIACERAKRELYSSTDMYIVDDGI